MPAFFDSDIKPEKVILPISLGQRYHNGQKLQDTVDLLLKSGCKEVVIIIADTLQVYNEKAKGSTCKSDDEIKNTLRVDGDLWQKKTQDYIDLLREKAKNKGRRFIRRKESCRVC